MAYRVSRQRARWLNSAISRGEYRNIMRHRRNQRQWHGGIKLAASNIENIGENKVESGNQWQSKYNGVASQNKYQQIRKRHPNGINDGGVASAAKMAASAWRNQLKSENNIHQYNLMKITYQKRRRK